MLATFIRGNFKGGKDMNKFNRYKPALTLLGYGSGITLMSLLINIVTHDNLFAEFPWFIIVLILASAVNSLPIRPLFSTPIAFLFFTIFIVATGHPNAFSNIWLYYLVALLLIVALTAVSRSFSKYIVKTIK